MTDLLALIRNTLEAAGITHRRSSVVVLNRSSPIRTAVAALVFLDDGGAPSVFVKASPDAAAGAELRREHANLEALHGDGTRLVARAVPAPLHLGTHDGHTVLAETVLDGRRMKNFPPDAYFASPAFRTHFASILDWLEALHDCRAAGAGTEDHAPDDVVRRYRASFGRSAELDRLLDETVAHLADRDLPRSPWHRDFCSANILVRPDGGIGVIDWEHPLVRTWPLLDLLHCVSSIQVARYRRGAAARIENFRRLHFTAHPNRDMLREGVLEHARAIGVEERDLLPLSALAWTIYANHKFTSQRGHKPPAGMSAHWPLIMFEADRCVNLELLAAARDRYVFLGA